MKSNRMTQTIINKSFVSKFTILFTICLFLSVNMDAKSPDAPETKEVEAKDAAQVLKKVRGFVVDEFGEPMVGVVVDALGSHKSVITNTEGKYSLMALETDILKFSQIGVSEKEEKITSSRIVNVALAIED